MKSAITVRPLRVDDAEAVAAFHIAAIHTGFISSLGQRFVTALYKAIVLNDLSFGLVAQADGRMVGFVTFTHDIRRLYRSIVFKNGPRLATILAGALLDPPRLKKIAQTLLYPGRTHPGRLPRAELLSLAVDQRVRGRGVATRLVDEGLRRCRAMDLNRIKVCVGATNEPANALYCKAGFCLTTEFEHHGVACRIYVIDMTTHDAPDRAKNG